MATSDLSRQDRSRGLYYYYRHVFLNEIGFTFLADYAIILLGICLGATNTQLGFLISAMSAAGLVILLAPILFGGLRLIRTYVLLWFLRGLCGTLYLTAIFIPDRFSDWRIIFLLAGYCGFAICHNLSWPMKQTLEKSLIVTGECGAIQNHIGNIMNRGKLAAVTCCFILLSIPVFTGQRGLMLLCIAGITANTLSAWMLSRIRINERVESVSGNAFRSLLENFRYRNTIATALLYWGSLVLMIALYFLIPTFDKVSDLPFNRIFAYSIATAAALAAAGYGMRKFTTKLGNKTLLVFALLAVMAIGLLLTAMPSYTHWGFLMLTGTVAIMTTGLVSMLISRLLQECIPSVNKMGFTSILNFFGAIAAVTAGYGFGKAADLEISAIIRLPHTYSIVFAGMTTVAFLMLLCAMFILRESSSPQDESAGQLFFWPDSLKSALLMDSLRENARKPELEKLVLTQVTMSTSGLDTEEIRRRLKSPLMRVKEDLINSLFFCPRPELKQELIEEAADTESWWRKAAVFALGAYPGTDTEKTLFRIYNEESSPYLKSLAASSLARIGNCELLEELRAKLFSHTELDVETTLNLIVAISLMDKEGTHLSEMFKISNLCSSAKFRQHVLVLFSRRLGGDPGMDHFLYLENLEQYKGVDELIGEIISIPEFCSALPQLKSSFRSANHAYLLQWCHNLLEPLPLTGSLAYLRQGIGQLREHQHPSKDDTMAAVFFTWLLLNRYHAGQGCFGRG